MVQLGGDECRGVSDNMVAEVGDDRELDVTDRVQGVK